MPKKRGKKPAKAAAVEEEVLTDEQFCLRALQRALPDGDAEELELGAALLSEGLAELREAEELEVAVEEVLDGAGVDAGDALAAITSGLRAFQLGLADPTAVFETSAGSFEAELFLDRELLVLLLLVLLALVLTAVLPLPAGMPITVSNFVALARSGFYDGTHIHRVVADFMVQFGCPLTKDAKGDVSQWGEGNPGGGSTFPLLGSEEGEEVTRGADGEEVGCIQDEHPAEHRISNGLGALAMANKDLPNTGGGQLFVNLSDNAMLDWFDDSSSESKHPVFGQVSEEGMEAVLKIGRAKVNEEERPVKPIKLKSVRIR